MKNSKRYKKNKELLEKDKLYDINEAIELLKNAQKAKFDETVEAHFKLNINPEKTEQQVRLSVDLPYGTGKNIRIAVFTENQDEISSAKQMGAEIAGGENLIEEVKAAGNLNTDVAIATPGIMPKLAKIAKILGPRGLMPNPKSETVTQDIAKTISMLKKGKVNFKSDKNGNVHVAIGKISFDSAKIKDNYEALKKVLDKSKPSGVQREIYLQYFSFQHYGSRYKNNLTSCQIKKNRAIILREIKRKIKI